MINCGGGVCALLSLQRVIFIDWGQELQVLSTYTVCQKENKAKT